MICSRSTSCNVHVVRDCWGNRHLWAWKSIQKIPFVKSVDMMLSPILSIRVDQLLKDATLAFVSTYPSWLSGYQAWLVWLLNKSLELNHFKHFGDSSFSRKIAVIVLKLWNLVKGKKRAKSRTFNLETWISHCETNIIGQLGHKKLDGEGWVGSRWLLGGWSDWNYKVQKEQDGAKISNLILWMDI